MAAKRSGGGERDLQIPFNVRAVGALRAWLALLTAAHDLRIGVDIRLQLHQSSRVCKLTVAWISQVYLILDEFILGGEIQESSKRVRPPSRVHTRFWWWSLLRAK